MDTLNNLKNIFSTVNILIYIVIFAVIIGFTLDRLLSLKRVITTIKTWFNHNVEIDPIFNYDTIVKYLNSNNPDLFITSCSYMKSHSRIPKEIQKSLIDIMMKEGQFKNQDWITFEIKSIAMHYICMSIVKNNRIFTKGEPLYIMDNNCPRLDDLTK